MQKDNNIYNLPEGWMRTTIGCKFQIGALANLRGKV